MNIYPAFPRLSYLGLLISLVFFFVVAPFFSVGAGSRLMLDLSILMILFIAVYISSDSIRNTVIAILLASPWLVRLFHVSVQVDEMTLACTILFFAFVIYELLRKVFHTYVV